MTNKQLLAKLAIDKSLLKEYSNNEYSRIVYMDNNSEFQIQIFNPYTYTIGAVISIDNKSFGNTLYRSQMYDGSAGYRGPGQ